MRRDGFTILEVLMAVLVLSLGLVGITGATASTTRMIAAGRWHVRASALGMRLVESQRSGACPPVGAGEAVEGPLRARWTISAAAGGRARLVVAVVETPGSGGAGVDTIAATIGC